MMEGKVAIVINPIRGDILNPKKGGDIYNNLIINKLITDGYRIVLLVPSNQSIAKKHSKIQYHQFPSFAGIGSLTLSLNPFYLRLLIKVIKQIDNKSKLEIILVGPFGAFGAYLLSKILHSKMIYVAHNVETDRYSEKSVFEHEAIALWLLKPIVMFLEIIATNGSDNIITISKTDKKRFAEKYKIPAEKIKVYPPRAMVLTNQNVKESEKRQVYTIKIVFHGSYKYLPNKEAFKVIKEYISKKIRYKSLLVTFGNGFPKLKCENLISLGFVKDIYMLLSLCDIAVVPLKRGAGVKLKMLDYMVAGLPIVTTKKGAEGLGLINGVHALIVDNVNEKFVKAIEYLVENPKIRKKLGHNAKKLIEIKYNTTTIDKVVR